MSEICKGNVSTIISRANRPTINNKINKLISCIETEKTHKSIVLLLIELAEHHELSSDNTISLQYYLDMFQDLNGEPPLSETGILLLNSAIIYGRSVDDIHRTVKKLFLSLINPEENATERFEENLGICIPHTPNAVTKSRKRSLDELNKSHEIEMSIKRYKLISNNNRFEEGISGPSQKDKEKFENVIQTSIESWIKDYTNPVSCLFSSIEDFDYEDEVDLKKKYKLLTNHLEHRYNTLTPDISFKMYFKIKDYIDVVYNDSTNTDMWPLLSDAYIQRFVNLENQILHILGYNTCDEYETEEISKTDGEVLSQCGDNIIETTTNPIDFCVHTDNDILNTKNEQNLSKFPCKTSLSSALFMQNDFSSLGRDDLCQRVHSPSEGNHLGDDKQIKNILTKSRENLTAVRVILPHLDDEGVYFSELDVRDQQMLSPAVIATDMFRCVKNKANVVVIIDDVLKRIYNIQEPKTKMLLLPISSREKSSVSLNFLKIDPKFFKRRRVFKLGPDFHLLKQERLNIISHKRNQSNHSEMYFRLCEDVTRVPISPASSPNYEPDFLGFPDEILLDKNRSLSRDSGISLQIEHDLNVDSSNRNSLLELNEDYSKKKTNTIKPNKNGILSESFTGEQNVFIQISLEKFLSDDENNDAEGENMPHINVAKDVKLKDNITSLMTKVQRWHRHLQPLLMQSKDRHHFDIVKLGTDILNHFEENNQRNNIISFQNVMENKDSSLVSRYFLSTLLLANQGNIGININHPNIDEPADLNNIGLRLLNKRRYNTNKYPGEEKKDYISSSIGNEETKKCVSVACATIRTLKQPCTSSTTDEHDSGVSMSDGCSI